jgi:hypothetical protein
MRAFKIGSWSALVTLTAASALSSVGVGCGGGSEEPSADAPAAVVAAPVATTPAPTPTAPLIDPAPVPTTPAPVAAPCGPSTLCLDVTSLRQGLTPHAGRLILVWMPLAGGPKEIAYDVPFAGTETQVTIPLASVTPPTDANAFCGQRDGSGKCAGTIKIGFGMVVVSEDQNANGVAELGENVLGLSDANVLYSATALKPPPPGFVWSGRPMAEAFPSGVEQGANVYVSAGVGTQTLVPAMAGQKFGLKVCDSTNPQECEVTAPF